MPDLLKLLGSGAAKKAGKKLKGRKAQLEQQEAEALGEKPKTDDMEEAVKMVKKKKSASSNDYF